MSMRWVAALVGLLCWTSALLAQVDVWVTSGGGHEVEELSRRAAAIREQRRASHGAILLFDAGDTFPADQRLADRVADAVAEMAYDAVAPGEADLVGGPRRYEALAARSRATALSASVPVTATSAFVPCRIWEVNGVLVGVTAVLEAPVASLEKVVPGLNKVADFTIVLCHTGWNEATAIAREVDGIDVLVVGHGGHEGGRTESVGKTMVVDAGRLGQAFGHVRMGIERVDRDSNQRRKTLEARIVPIRAR